MSPHRQLRRVEMESKASFSGPFLCKYVTHGCPGLISSISHAPNASMIALGSLTPAPWNVVVYDTDTNVPSLYFGLGQDRPAGVTQVLACSFTSDHPWGAKHGLIGYVQPNVTTRCVCNVPTTYRDICMGSSESRQWSFYSLYQRERREEID